MKTIKTDAVINPNIVFLNGIKSKKLSSLGGKKRAQLRADKHAAEFILTHWDNGVILSLSIKQAEQTQKDGTKISDEVLNIWRQRAEELTPVEEPEKKVGRKPFRKIGDHHPKHQEWLWTEYKPGKFDWRIDPTLRKKVGRKPGQTASSSKTVKKG